MKIIKLTSADIDSVIYVNASHITVYWRMGATSTRIYLTGEDDYVDVKETPEEIIELIKQTKEI